MSLLRKLSFIAANMSVIAALQAAHPTASTRNADTHKPVATNKHDPAQTDRHEAERKELIDIYAPLNADFEGMFPALYNDHGKVAAPGGVHLDPNTVLTCQMLTPLTNTPVTVVSYNKAVRAELDEMAKGNLPEHLKKIYDLQETTITVKDLDIETLPKQGAKTHNSAVYLMSPVDRDKYHLQAIRDHLQRVEESFRSVDDFYSMPFALQVLALDLGYTRRLQSMKCGRALLQLDLDAPNLEVPGKTNREVIKEEAYTSKAEHNGRRHIIRKGLVDAADKLPSQLPQVNDAFPDLAAGETHLASLGYSVIQFGAERNAEKAAKKTKTATNQPVLVSRRGDGLTQ